MIVERQITHNGWCGGRSDATGTAIAFTGSLPGQGEGPVSFEAGNRPHVHSWCVDGSAQSNLERTKKSTRDAEFILALAVTAHQTVLLEVDCARLKSAPTHTATHLHEDGSLDEVLTEGKEGPASVAQGRATQNGGLTCEELNTTYWRPSGDTWESNPLSQPVTRGT